MGEENSQIVLIFVISAAVVVVLAVILILFLLIYQKRIVTQENRLQRLENERQQVLLKATIEGQERERQRLARDLHDGIGSLLSGLSLNLKFQKSHEDPGSKQARFLTEACDMVEEGIENVRRVSHDLMPATLEKFGLLTAMQESCDTFNKGDEFKVHLAHVNSPYSLPRETAIGLLRIFQELLNNTYKHSGASEVNIQIEYRPEGIRMYYRDNGKGFDIDAMNSEGIGFKNIQSRLMVLQGTIQMNNANGKGFEANIEVPVISKENKP